MAGLSQSQLEEARVRRALPDAELLDYTKLGFRDLVRDGLSWADAGRETEARAVNEIGLRQAIVPGDFPVGLADRLRRDGVELVVDDEAVARRRRAKSSAELEGIRAAQHAAHAGMSAARGLLARAEPGSDRQLAVDGKPLLAEGVREAIRAACAAEGAPCPPDIIVGSVHQGYGHEPGSGPLPAGLPIHVDIWPRHEESACWADMARTFLVGDPAPELAEQIAEQERLAREALEQAKAAVRPGVTGRELHDATCDLFEAAGYSTQRTAGNDDGPDGFQYSLGHGVGLEVHEPPGLGLAGTEPLVAGDVIAIEPGLWDSRVGAVVSEDLVLVTEDGCEVLTDFPYDLSPTNSAA